MTAVRNRATPEDCPLHDYIKPKEDVANADMTGRIGFLEGGFQTLTRDVQELTRGLSTLGDQLNRSVSTLGGEIGELRDLVASKLEAMTQRTTDALDTMSVRTQSQAKPNFLAIITIVGMAGGLAAYVLNGHHTEILATKSDVKQVQADYAKAEFLRGQAEERTTETSKALAAFIIHYDQQHTALDDKLQKENLKQAADLKEQLAYMDSKLGKELDVVTRRTDGQASEMALQLADLKRWQLAHADGDSEFRGRIASKQEMIDREVERLGSWFWDYRSNRLKMYEERDANSILSLEKGSEAKPKQDKQQ